MLQVTAQLVQPPHLISWRFTLPFPARRGRVERQRYSLWIAIALVVLYVGAGGATRGPARVQTFFVTPRLVLLFITQRIEPRLDACAFALHALENASAIRVVRRAVAA